MVYTFSSWEAALVVRATEFLGIETKTRFSKVVMTSLLSHSRVSSVVLSFTAS